MTDVNLTIIYRVYNDNDLLVKSLESIFNQSVKNFELIIIDDSATIEAKQILEKFNLSSKNIRLVKLFETYGRSFCYNLGASKANGKYLYFAEDKNIFDVDFVKKIYECIESKEFDYISFIVENINDKNFSFNQNTQIDHLNLKNYILNSSISIRDKIFRKKFIEKNKIKLTNYKNFYSIFLFEILTNAKTGFYLNEKIIKLERSIKKNEIFSYNLYDILESVYLLANKLENLNLDIEIKQCFSIWLSRLCLIDFLCKISLSYQNDKILNIAIDKAYETIKKVDPFYKKNTFLDQIINPSIKNYIKNFKKSLNYVKMNNNCI